MGLWCGKNEKQDLFQHFFSTFGYWGNPFHRLACFWFVVEPLFEVVGNGCAQHKLVGLRTIELNSLWTIGHIGLTLKEMNDWLKNYE